MLVDEPVRIIDWLKRLALISTLRSMSVPCLNCVILLELEALRIGLELICSVDGYKHICYSFHTLSAMVQEILGKYSTWC